MSLNRVYIIPHGDEILDLPNRESMEMHDAIEKVTAGDDSGTVVIISPHGLKLGNHVSVLSTEFFSGYYRLKTMNIRKKYLNNRILASAIVKSSDLAEEASFVTSSGPLSRFPLDFGTLIPLQFFRQKKIVVMGQPRIWELEKLTEFGKKLARVCMNQEEKISIIISADQAHCHSPDGPYGFAEESVAYEKIIEECTMKSDFGMLYSIKKEFVNKAKPDSYWNMLIFDGIMKESEMRSLMDFHYVQYYFGMMLAHLVP